MDLLLDVVVHLQLGLELPPHGEVGPAEEADCDAVLELAEDLFGGSHVLPLEGEELLGHHDALVVNLVAEVLEVPLADLHPPLESLLLDALYAVLLDHLALLLVGPPVLRTMFTCAVPRLLAIAAHEHSLSIADFAALVSPQHNQ